MNRRQLLMTLAAGTVTSGALLREALQRALEAPVTTVDDWQATVDGYAHEYMIANDLAGLLPRLGEDLALLQLRLDSPALAGVASRLLILYGLSFQNTTAVPSATTTAADPGDEALHWYRLGVAAADRSSEPGVQVWARGRAALSLAYWGTALKAVRSFATEALSIGSPGDSGRLSGLLGLAHAQALEGDKRGAHETLAEARRVFDKVGASEGVNDFSMPEWRLQLITSLLGARLGDERLTLEAQQQVRRAMPEAVARIEAYLDLHQALLMVRTGDQLGGITLAQGAMTKHPMESTFPLLLVREITGPAVGSSLG